MMDEIEIKYERRSRFSDPILELSKDNPVIMRIMEMYINGQIITMDEALNQMVVNLAKDWGRQQKELFNYCMNFPQNFKLNETP